RESIKYGSSTFVRASNQERVQTAGQHLRRRETGRRQILLRQPSQATEHSSSFDEGHSYTLYYQGTCEASQSTIFDDLANHRNAELTRSSFSRPNWTKSVHCIEYGFAIPR